MTVVFLKNAFFDRDLDFFPKKIRILLKWRKSNKGDIERI